MAERKNCVVIKDRNDNVVFVATTKYLNDKEIANMTNQAFVTQQGYMRVVEKLENRIKELENQLINVNNDIKLLKGEE